MMINSREQKIEKQNSQKQKTNGYMKYNKHILTQRLEKNGKN